ncbi:MAG: glycosyltransferase family 4 protein [Planctomycetota bacterium]
MHIALQIFTADKRRGGMERYTHDLAEALIARGEKVTTLATRFAHDWPGERMTARVCSVDVRALQYEQFAKATVPDSVVHAMQPVAHADVYTPHSGFVPTLYDCGGPLRRFANRLNLKRRVVRQTEAKLITGRPLIACLSRRQAADAKQAYPTIDHRLHVIHHGVDLDHFDPTNRPAVREKFRTDYGIPAGAPLVLFISQNFRRKRLDVAIDALRLGKHHLLVVGRDSPTGYERHFGQVHFVGALPDALPAHAAADALILPTLDEPFGLVVLESIAMGNPVVLYHTAGATEMVVDGATGRVVREDNPIAWREALREVIADRAGWRARCLAARDSLSFDRHVDALMHLYRDVR